MKGLLQRNLTNTVRQPNFVTVYVQALETFLKQESVFNFELTPLV